MQAVVIIGEQDRVEIIGIKSNKKINQRIITLMTMVIMWGMITVLVEIIMTQDKIIKLESFFCFLYPLVFNSYGT